MSRLSNLDERLNSSINPELSSPVERKLSLRDSRVTQKEHRTSLSNSIRRISLYYDNNVRVLTSNFAGAEDDTDSIREGDATVTAKAPFVSCNDKTQISVTNLSKYQEVSQKGELGFWASLFTFIKVSLVAGFIFLPAGFQNGGWLFSIIAIFFLAIFMIYCNISLSECTDAASTFSFSKIGQRACGKVGYYLVEFGIAISQICFPCSYANLITQILNGIINIWLGTNKNYYLYIAIGLALILVPLCLLRNINKFSSFHLIGDIAVLATIITLAYESIYNISKDPDFNYDHAKMFNSGWAKLLGMAITSLEGVGVILPIKENMKDKKQFNLVVIIGITVVCLILTSFPLIMYLCYQDNVQEIVLTNLDMKKIYIQTVLLLFMFSVLIVYPVQLFPAFIILENIFCKSGKSEKLKRLSAANSLEVSQSSMKTFWLENLLRIIIVLGTITVGILSIKKFDTMLSLVGCAICTPIALILPTIFHYQLYKNTQSKFRNFIDISVAVLGTTMSITVLIFTLI